MPSWTATGIPVASLDIGELEVGPQSKEARLGRAVRACRTGRATQDEVAERTGIGQTTLSAYERGKSVPPVLALQAIETACGRDPGWIMVQAGLIVDVTTVPQAIGLDPRLTDDDRDVLLAAWSELVDANERRGGQDASHSDHR